MDVDAPQDDDAGWEGWDVETDSSDDESESEGWINVDDGDDDLEISDSEDDEPKKTSQAADGTAASGETPADSAPRISTLATTKVQRSL